MRGSTTELGVEYHVIFSEDERREFYEIMSVLEKAKYDFKILRDIKEVL